MDRETLEQQDGDSELDPNPVKRLRTAGGEAAETRGGGGCRGAVDVVGEELSSTDENTYLCVHVCIITFINSYPLINCRDSL